MSSRAELYVPPQSYWTELKQLDNKVLGLAELDYTSTLRKEAPVKVPLLFRHMPVGVYHAYWEGDEPNTYVKWARMQFKLGGVPILSSVACAEIFKPHVTVSRAISSDRTSLVGTITNYSIGRRFARTYDESIADINGDTEQERNSITGGKEADELGLSLMTEETYDQLIDELRRGASGDFALPIND